MMNLLAAAMVAFLFSVPGKAMDTTQDCSCDSVAGSTETILETNSSMGRHLRLRFADAPVTRALKAATLCVEPIGQVKEVVLWMPDHGHGSSPTRLTTATATCTKIDRISFVMSGRWELRVALADNDKGTFTVNVSQ